MRKSLFIILVLYSLQISAQKYISVGITFGGLAFHPAANTETKHYKIALDKQHKLTLFGAIAFHFTYQFNDYFGFKISQMLVPYDCAGKFSGITQVGINMSDNIIGFRNENHQLSACWGPLFYYRKNWKSSPFYIQDSTFINSSKSGKWEKKFIWYAGHAQYDYFYKKGESFSLNIFPGYPHIYSFTTGYQQTRNYFSDKK